MEDLDLERGPLDTIAAEQRPRRPLLEALTSLHTMTWQGAIYVPRDRLPFERAPGSDGEG